MVKNIQGPMVGNQWPRVEWINPLHRMNLPPSRWTVSSALHSSVLIVPAVHLALATACCKAPGQSTVPFLLGENACWMFCSSFKFLMTCLGLLFCLQMENASSSSVFLSTLSEGEDLIFGTLYSLFGKMAEKGAIWLKNKQTQKSKLYFFKK